MSAETWLMVFEVLRIPATAETSASGVVTVTLVPPSPPVVVPIGLSFANPTRLKSDAVGSASVPASGAAIAKTESLMIQD